MMAANPNVPMEPKLAVPPDNHERKLAIAQPDGNSPHIGVVGDTYTLLLSGKDTAGRFCLIDMHCSSGWWTASSSPRLRRDLHFAGGRTRCHLSWFKAGSPRR